MKPTRRLPRKLAEAVAAIEGEVDQKRLRRLLARGPSDLAALAAALKVSRGRVVDAVDALRSSGANVYEAGGRFELLREPAAPPPDDGRYLRVSDAEGWHRFGVISDTHLGSKYARLDVCDALYDWFAAEGVREVYHAGNWIDGEFRFNRMDLLPEAHGLQAQLDYFVRHYPQREGIKTRYVAGDDHEGWYAQRELIDIGAMLQQTAEAAGRMDLEYLGYKEAFVTLEHAQTGEHARLLVDHPGGGSAYALSYAPQKRIEALQGGEKPAIWLFGHWHKLGYFNTRNVHAVLTGCTKDLDPFGRKKGLEYHVGGWIVEARQDPQGGIGSLTPHLRQFFDRGYYNMQFDPARPLAKRPAPRGRKGAR